MEHAWTLARSGDCGGGGSRAAAERRFVGIACGLKRELGSRTPLGGVGFGLVVGLGFVEFFAEAFGAEAASGLGIGC